MLIMVSVDGRGRVKGRGLEIQCLGCSLEISVCDKGQGQREKGLFPGISLAWIAMTVHSL
jgi:hypothetical protein